MEAEEVLSVATTNLAPLDYIAVIIAITTAVYTFGTFLLWKTTRATLLLAKTESINTQKRLEATLLASMIAWHRELFTFILSNEDFAKILADSHNVEVLKLKEEYLGALLINNALQAYYHHRHGIIEKDIWSMILADTRELFGMEIVRKKWSALRNTYPIDFQIFIDEQVLARPSSSTGKKK